MIKIVRNNQAHYKSELQLPKAYTEIQSPVNLDEQWNVLMPQSMDIKV